MYKFGSRALSRFRFAQRAPERAKPEPVAESTVPEPPPPNQPAFPDGHFYSPIVNVEEASAQASTLWPAHGCSDVPGIEFDAASHCHILDEVFPRYIADYDYPERLDEAEPAGFFSQNSQFSWLDARAYFVFLRHFSPRRVIEVGAGFSTLLLVDVNRRFMDNRIGVTCIEPYPRPFVTRLGTTQIELVVKKVQDVPLERFQALRAGDILFIDSSHVAKTGSDVNFLYFEVLPRLARGVRVHIHDVFLPFEYPRAWVIDENRSWNEQYLVRAYLMHSHSFRVTFGSSYAFLRFPDRVCAALALQSGAGFGGGSLWIEKIA